MTHYPILHCEQTMRFRLRTLIDCFFRVFPESEWAAIRRPRFAWGLCFSILGGGIAVYGGTEPNMLAVVFGLVLMTSGVAIASIQP